MAEHSSGAANDDDDVNWNTDDEIDNFQTSPSSSPVDYSSETSVHPAGTNVSHMGISDENIAMFIDMGFSMEMIERAMKETGGENPEAMLILETLVKNSKSSEASSSKSSVINQFIRMGFPEDLVVTTIQEYGEENTNEITSALLRSAETEKMLEAENEDINNDLSDNNGDANLYSVLSSSDEENELGVGRLQTLIEMGYPREDASIAVERCGENASLAEIVDFILATQLERQFCEAPDEEEPINNRRAEPQQPKRRRLNSSDEETIHHLTPDSAPGPPYFYYENVVMAPWDKISQHLYGIKPEFVDSQYFSAAARKRGCIHNLPINRRFEIQPPPKYTIQEEFPLTKNWWPDWDKRTKFDSLLICTRNAQLTNKIRERLEEDDSDPNVQREVIEQCKKWNLVWVGKNKTAQLEPEEMEKLLGLPQNHTRGGGITRTERYKCLVNSFQVNTLAYQLSVLKPLYTEGINVLSLFTGIGGGEVALHRLQIPINLVVSVEISEVKRNIVRSFWDQTDQKGNLIQFADIRMLDEHKIEQLMEQYGGFDLVIGGSPCNNQIALEGDQLSLFFEYCRILKAVRSKASRMGR